MSGPPPSARSGSEGAEVSPRSGAGDASARSAPDPDCECTQETPTSPQSCICCDCPPGDHGLVIHRETCLLFRHETLMCECSPPPEFASPASSGTCNCGEIICVCNKDDKRDARVLAGMPGVLESTHPLMQKFQESLRRFLEKENELAEKEILNLKDEVRLAKLDYDTELEEIYHSDHGTNKQRVLIQEYEATLTEKAKEREKAEEQMRQANEEYKAAKEKLDTEMRNERDTSQELEALSALVRQLEKWREETESDLTVSQRMTDKMKQEKRAKAEEKRELDMVIYALNNEVWNLESRVELFKKQMEIKSVEMAKVNDRVTAYATELEDLELDKKRLLSLWNSVLVNIKHRDNVFGTIRNDYRDLQENFRTLTHTLDVTKKGVEEEMHNSKEIELNRDKITYQMNAFSKIFETENNKREYLERKIEELKESVYMNERDQEMIKMENLSMSNILTSTEKEYERRCEQKSKLENEILENLQECLLNNKATESMANGIKKMRDMSRKLEISLMKMENQHAKVMLDIEAYRFRQQHNAAELEKHSEKVRKREAELEAMQQKYDQKSLFMMKKQRELDGMIKKYNALKVIFDDKSPQEMRIYKMEQQVKALRERTETLQQEWLRLQGHVVKLSAQYQKCVADVSLINKQIQICDQKTMGINNELQAVRQERLKVERSLRDLRGRLQVLERTRKEANDRNQDAHRTNAAITFEYSASLKDAESKLIDLEEEIEMLDKEKMDLTQELDRVQREALIWQRKGILAVELKRSIHDAKSASGEIGQMKHEIHRMEVRREQLRRTGEKLAEDLAQYVTRRENAIDKSRATAAMEAAKGTSHRTSQSQYHHKLRLAKADLSRVTKEVQETKAQIDRLQQELATLTRDAAEAGALNSQMEERVASVLQDCRAADRHKQWLLEQLVRSQRLGSELGVAVKRQSVKVKKPKKAVLEEYELAKALNNDLQFIANELHKNYPHLHEQFETIANTLNIFAPDMSPRLTEDALCDPRAEINPCDFPVRDTGPDEPFCHCPQPESPDSQNQ